MTSYVMHACMHLCIHVNCVVVLSIKLMLKYVSLLSGNANTYPTNTHYTNTRISESLSIV